MAHRNPFAPNAAARKSTSCCRSSRRLREAARPATGPNRLVDRAAPIAAAILMARAHLELVFRVAGVEALASPGRLLSGGSLSLDPQPPTQKEARMRS
jgi:hypothetical protein